jgi:hypothetical protein
LTIFSESDAPKEGVQVLFGHQKQGSFAMDLACPEYLNVHSLTILPYHLLERRSDLTPLT